MIKSKRKMILTSIHILEFATIKVWFSFQFIHRLLDTWQPERQTFALKIALGFLSLHVEIYDFGLPRCHVLSFWHCFQLAIKNSCFRRKRAVNSALLSQPHYSWFMSLRDNSKYKLHTHTYFLTFQSYICISTSDLFPWLLLVCALV